MSQVHTSNSYNTYLNTIRPSAIICFTMARLVTWAPNSGGHCSQDKANYITPRVGLGMQVHSLYISITNKPDAK